MRLFLMISPPVLNHLNIKNMKRRFIIAGQLYACLVAFTAQAQVNKGAIHRATPIMKAMPINNMVKVSSLSTTASGNHILQRATIMLNIGDPGKDSLVSLDVTLYNNTHYETICNIQGQDYNARYNKNSTRTISLPMPSNFRVNYYDFVYDPAKYNPAVSDRAGTLILHSSGQSHSPWKINKLTLTLGFTEGMNKTVTWNNLTLNNNNNQLSLNFNQNFVAE